MSARWLHCLTVHFLELLCAVGLPRLASIHTELQLLLCLTKFDLGPVYTNSLMECRENTHKKNVVTMDWLWQIPSPGEGGTKLLSFPPIFHNHLSIKNRVDKLPTESLCPRRLTVRLTALGPSIEKLSGNRWVHWETNLVLAKPKASLSSLWATIMCFCVRSSSSPASLRTGFSIIYHSLPPFTIRLWAPRETLSPLWVLYWHPESCLVYNKYPVNI